MNELTQEKRNKIIESLTEGQRAVYDNLVGDKNKLKNEFKLCQKFYSEAITVINDKTTGMEVRHFMRGVSDYWQRRMKILERSLETLIGFDEVRKIKNG